MAWPRSDRALAAPLQSFRVINALTHSLVCTLSAQIHFPDSRFSDKPRLAGACRRPASSAASWFVCSQSPALSRTNKHHQQAKKFTLAACGLATATIIGASECHVMHNLTPAAVCYLIAVALHHVPVWLVSDILLHRHHRHQHHLTSSYPH